MFVEDVNKLEEWLTTNNNTNSELAYWLPKYILYRGTNFFADMGLMSPRMRAIAISQDTIGWRNFMEGRVSNKLYFTLHLHLSTSPSIINSNNWMKSLISKVLHITHSQWIFCNLSLHDQQRGHLCLNNRIEALHEIETLADTDPKKIPPDSKFLLEFDFDRLCEADLEHQQYWIYVIKAARKAGWRTARSGRRALRVRATFSKSQSRRQRMGINKEERHVELDHRAGGPAEDERHRASLQPPTASRRPHPSSIEAAFKSNKRHRSRLRRSDTEEQQFGVTL